MSRRFQFSLEWTLCAILGAAVACLFIGSPVDLRDASLPGIIFIFGILAGVWATVTSGLWRLVRKGARTTRSQVSLRTLLIFMSVVAVIAATIHARQNVHVQAQLEDLRSQVDKLENRPEEPTDR